MKNSLGELLKDIALVSIGIIIGSSGLLLYLLWDMS